MTITRYWMTGCMAVVTMVAHQAAQAQRLHPADAHARRHTLSRNSPFPASTTIHRIEQAAHDSGLGVFATLDNSAEVGHTEQVLVLSDIDGVTPIVQDDAWRDTGFGLPLEVRVTELDDGTSLVTMLDAQGLDDAHVLPDTLTHRVSSLPRLIDSALTRDAA